uniref:General transcription factor IIH subunit 3 n=1 Tax=Ixodes ricinus TaxID=34613 RepID=A0A0K8R6R2_IXORI
MPCEDEGSLLVAIIDTNPCASLLESDQGIVSKLLDALTVFCNSHLMLNPCNKLAIIASHSHRSTFIYPKPQESSSDTYSVDGQYELFTEVTGAIKDGVKELVLSDDSESAAGESLLTGGLSLALCYINRIEKESSSQNKIASRILVLSASGESASQYLNFMNVFFTAQKKNVIIDACVLEKDSGLLQQGCDITGGKYMKVPNHAGLLQYLLWVFLPDKTSRNYMVFPPPVHVDYRAACFCHRNLIEIGYVCSVCLSIFCAFSPICSTCQTAFKFTGPLPSLLKSKKKKQRLGI